MRLLRAGARPSRRPDPTLARLFVRFAISGLVAVMVIGAVAFVIVRRSATSGAIRQAKELTELAGRGIVKPQITAGVLPAIRRLWPGSIRPYASAS